MLISRIEYTIPGELRNLADSLALDGWYLVNAVAYAFTPAQPQYQQAYSEASMTTPISAAPNYTCSALIAIFHREQ